MKICKQICGNIYCVKSPILAEVKPYFWQISKENEGPVKGIVSKHEETAEGLYG